MGDPHSSQALCMARQDEDHDKAMVGILDLIYKPTQIDRHVEQEERKEPLSIRLGKRHQLAHERSCHLHQGLA